MRSDWMPGKRGDTLNMARMWRGALVRTGDAWAVAAHEIVELNALITRMERATDAAMASGGGALATGRVRDAYAALTRFMRVLKRRRFTSPPLVAADFTALGLKPRDAVPTGHHEVRETVAFVLEIQGIREVLVRFWIAGADHRAKPADCVGAVIRWAVLDAPPAGYDALTHYATATRTPHALRFDLPQRGKTVYTALAWQNRRGILGAWSEIEGTVIP